VLQEAMAGIEGKGIIIGAAGLLLLHGPGGREIRLNGPEVTKLHASIPGEPNWQLPNGVNCLVFTTDGKIASVVESCETVSLMIDRRLP
jgi:hypothetical protein